ncbi:hypothetical protein BJ912DRAFT_474480 [Pholiota molesta]|nr:hypothetical protein BJ912DRAFT_474480 [Pholiota molesta]
MEIPFDILPSIFDFLDPLDVIVFGKTCKHIHEATSTRSVWLNIAKKVCFRNGIFAPSFNIERMSVLELKHMATSPSRMLAILSAKPTRPYRLPRIPFSGYLVPLSRELRSVFLVPGGRFLVGFSQSYVNVVDLQRNDNLQPRQLNEPDFAISKPFYNGRPMAIAPTRTGKCLYIVGTRRSSSEIETISVWQYDPEDPSLNDVASTILRSLSPVYTMIGCLAGDLFIFVGDSETRKTIYIWDFKKNLWASFDTSEHVNDEIDHVVYNEGKIICFSCSGATIWEMIQPHGSHCGETTTSLIFPMSQIPFNFPLNSGVITRTNTHYWEQIVNRGFPLTFDALDNDRISRRIEFPAFGTVSSNDSQPSYVQTTYNTDNFDSCRLVKQRYCDSKIIRTWAQTKRADIIYTSIPPLTCPPPASTSGVTKIALPSAIHSVSLQASNTIATSRLMDYSFDPLSGRLCSIEGRGGFISEINVVISDYLRHP